MNPAWQPLSVHLVTALVPVVVMSGWLWWRAPAPEPVPEPSTELRIPLDLRVKIGWDGYHLLGAADVLPLAPSDDAGGVLIPCTSGSWCQSPDDYDQETLGYLLSAIKHRRPDASAVSIVPQYQTPYGTIMRAMRAVQGVRTQDGGAIAYPTVAITSPTAG